MGQKNDFFGLFRPKNGPKLRKCDSIIKVWYKQTVRNHSRGNLSCFEVISTTQLMTTYILLDYSWFEVILSVQNGVQKNESFWETAYSAKSDGFRGIWPFWKRLTFQKSKNCANPSQMIKNHDQSLKQYDIRGSGGVGLIRSSKIGQKLTSKKSKNHL